MDLLHQDYRPCLRVVPPHEPDTAGAGLTPVTLGSIKGETMTTTRTAAALAAAACLAVLAAGCASHSPAPGAGAGRTTGTSTTAAPAAPSTPATTAPATTAPAGQAPAPRCHTGQLTMAFTGLNSAMGGQRGMTLILTNHSGATCHVYGYPGLAFLNSSGFSMTTHLTWMTAPHARVLLLPGGNAQAMLTWRVNPYPQPTSFDPDLVHITPPDEHAYLQAVWPGGPVRAGGIVAWPLRAAPAGPFPAGTGTIASALNGMCAALAADGTAVVAWKCSPGTGSQQWTGYSDGTLRIGGKCLDVTGPGAGARAEAATCSGAATQKWGNGQISYNDFGAVYNTGTRTVLTDPGNSTTNGTQLIMGPDRGDQSYPWRVSFYPYMKG
jgi:uncharacterized protein DUF4232/ricin-type beta-trefoil lectin protein